MSEDVYIPRLYAMKYGIIDEKFVNDATTQANKFSAMSDQIEQALTAPHAPPPPIPFLAQITNVTPIVTVTVTLADESEREIDVGFQYEWSKVNIEDHEVILPVGEIPDDVEGHPRDENRNIAKTQQLLGDTQGFAYNLCEMAHAELNPIIYGVDMSLKDYPNGFLPYPPDAKSYVWLLPVRAADGGEWYMFDRLGTHDGTCTKDVPDL